MPKNRHTNQMPSNGQDLYIVELKMVSSFDVTIIPLYMHVSVMFLPKSAANATLCPKIMKN